MDESVPDIHPKVDEIKPYVSVGPTQELSITVQKNTFDSAFLWATIIFGLALFTIVAITVFFAYQRSKLPPPPPPLEPITPNPTIHSNVGAAISATSFLRENISQDGSTFTTQELCESASNTIWNKSQCLCQPPFFGASCSLEKHTKRYYSVGVPDDNTLQINIIDKLITNGKSFVKDPTLNNACSMRCDNDADCIGFIYHRLHNNTGECTLLRDDVIVPKETTIPFFLDRDSTLYMRSSDNLHFRDRIFLASSPRAMAPRYWLVKESPGYIQLFPGEIHKLSFIPNYTKIYDHYTGIYCTHPFSIDEISLLLEKGETSQCYIHHPNTQINLPWTHREGLYVVYI